MEKIRPHCALHTIAGTEHAALILGFVLHVSAKMSLGAFFLPVIYW